MNLRFWGPKPQIQVDLGSIWGQIGVDLGSIWGRFGVDFGGRFPQKGQIRLVLGSNLLWAWQTWFFFFF